MLNQLRDRLATETVKAERQGTLLCVLSEVTGNFGDCKSLRLGLYELRIDWGPGYRVYYAMIGKDCVLLLCGGDKREQSSDIERALEFLKDYKERSGTS